MIGIILEIIGTVAFSVSGAYVGIKKKMDILGVAVMGLLTAVGGGILRDVIIGTTPTKAFENPLYAILAIVTAVIAFLPGIRERIHPDHFLWVVIDSIGLGAFTMVGVVEGMPFGHVFLAVFLGTITGVGGGTMRDVCAGEIPMIFVKHFYACPCILGAVLCALLYPVNAEIAQLAGFAFVFILRLLAAKFKWHLPKA